jgi:hypothetical protein
LSFLLFVVVVRVPFITVAADYWSGGMSGGWTATGGWDELVIAGRDELVIAGRVELVIAGRDELVIAGRDELVIAGRVTFAVA